MININCTVYTEVPSYWYGTHPIMLATSVHIHVAYDYHHYNVGYAIMAQIHLKDRILRCGYNFQCRDTLSAVTLAQQRRLTSTRTNWSDSDMGLAVDAVLNGMSIRQASEQFSIPRSTLGDKVSGRTQLRAHSGPKRILDDEQEEVLANFLIGCSSIGYAKSRAEVLTIVNQICQFKGVNRQVTPGWWEGFCKRHPNLTLRAASSMPMYRTLSSSPVILQNYFNILEETIAEYDLEGKTECHIQHG